MARKQSPRTLLWHLARRAFFSYTRHWQDVVLAAQRSWKEVPDEPCGTDRRTSPKLWWALAGAGNGANLVDILIAHRDDKARAALKLFLVQEPCLRVTGTAENGPELLHLVMRSRPDLVLLDWHLPGWPAADLLSALHAADEALKVLVLVSRPELRQVARRAGADGIINLWEPPQKVLTAILALTSEDGGILPEKHGTSNPMVEGDERTVKT